MKKNQAVKQPGKKSLLVIQEEPVVIRGIQAELVKISQLADRPMTVGQIHELYKKANPLSDRSRNELAKRVTELNQAGIMRWSGRRICPVTGRKASTFVANSGGYEIVLPPKIAQPAVDTKPSADETAALVAASGAMSAWSGSSVAAKIDPYLYERMASQLGSSKYALIGLDELLERFSTAWFLTKAFKRRLVFLRPYITNLINVAAKL